MNIIMLIAVGVLTLALVGTLLWIFSLKKRVDALELSVVRGIMEEKPENVRKVTETAESIYNLDRNSASWALREARRLHGLPK